MSAASFPQRGLQIEAMTKIGSISYYGPSQRQMRATGCEGLSKACLVRHAQPICQIRIWANDIAVRSIRFCEGKFPMLCPSHPVFKLDICLIVTNPRARDITLLPLRTFSIGTVTAMDIKRFRRADSTCMRPCDRASCKQTFGYSSY